MIVAVSSLFLPYGLTLRVLTLFSVISTIKLNLNVDFTMFLVINLGYNKKTIDQKIVLLCINPLHIEIVTLESNKVGKPLPRLPPYQTVRALLRHTAYQMLQCLSRGCVPGILHLLDSVRSEVFLTIFFCTFNCVLLFPFS